METYCMMMIQHDVDIIVTQSTNQNNKSRINDVISCNKSCNKLLDIHTFSHINLTMKYDGTMIME